MKKIVMQECGEDSVEYVFHDRIGQYVPHRAVWIWVSEEEWAEHNKCWARIQELQTKWEREAPRVG